MPEPKIVVKPTLKELQSALKKARKDLTNTFVPHKKIAIFLDRWVQKNFKSEGGNVGDWPELAAGGRWKSGKGKNAKRSFDASAKVLQDTGRLKNSFVPFATKLNAGIFSELSYAAMHNFGEGAVPERRMIPENSEVKEDIKEIYQDHIKKSKKVFQNL